MVELKELRTMFGIWFTEYGAENLECLTRSAPGVAEKLWDLLVVLCEKEPPKLRTNVILIDRIVGVKLAIDKHIQQRKVNNA